MCTTRIIAASIILAFCALVPALAAPQTSAKDAPRVAFNPAEHCSDDSFVAMCGLGELAAVNACLEFGTSADAVRARHASSLSTPCLTLIVM